MNQDNKRYKICINLTQNDQLITNYSDDITCINIIDMANRIIKILNNRFKLVQGIFNYMILQKTFNTEQYGVKIVLKNIQDESSIITTIIIIMNDIYLSLSNEISVFCYQFTQNNRSPDDKDTVYYLTPKTRLDDIYDNVSWSFSIDSFSQVYKDSGETIHNIVNNCIQGANMFIGIGGESGYYFKANKDKFKNAQLFTNSIYIYEDCKHANYNCELVDYTIFDLIKYYSDDCTLLVNISKNGLRGLAKIINGLNFKQIIYIGCTEESIRKDIDALSNYNVINRYVLPNNRYILDLNKY